MDRKIYLIGNAHLDPVWLWRWQEGFAEIKATFRSVLDRMDEYGDFKFASACSFYYMWIEKSDKQMFEEICQRVKEGRWSIVGGWGIQPDCNLPCGEAFARHGLMSQRYFKKKFGKIAEIGYNVDSFGHNGNIPKILRNSGMDGYVFMRPMKHEKELPGSLFKWQSMDGSWVTTYRIPETYCIDLGWFDAFEKIKDMDEEIPLMAYFGVGNHGGGPTIELLDKMHTELGKEYVYASPEEYFEDVKALEMPVIEDDLQFHAKGCYSACSQVKTGNRVSENKLIEAEKYSALSSFLVDTPYPDEKIDDAWKNILFNQFHDILGGCCIKEAYEDADWAFGEALNIASRTANYALQQISWNIDTTKGLDFKTTKADRELGWINSCVEELGTPLVVFNSLPFDVEQIVHTRYRAQVIKNEEEEIIPSQKVRASRTNGGDKWETAFVAKVPALGYSVYRMHYTDEQECENTFVCTENSIDNGKVKLVINEKTGEVSSIFVKEKNKEILAGETQTIFMDETNCDTWAHNIKEFKNVAGVCAEGTVKLIECGPVRATLRSEMKLFDTTVIRDYSVEKGSDVISVKVKVDFHEKHKMLKFSVPALVDDAKSYAKIPFGFIERPTDGTEQVCGEWAAICDDSGGVVIANSDKYSFDADKNVLSLTVLRGSVYADHCFGSVQAHDEFCEFMDQGRHEFKYTISVFRTITEAERQGQILNTPLTVIHETFHKGKLDSTYSGVSVSKENIIVTALKKYTDGDGWVLRCYETENIETDVEIALFGTKWSSKFGHNEVKTFIIQNDKVSECNFIEWME